MRTKNTNKTLLFLVILLCLVVAGLGYYTFDFHSKVQQRETKLIAEKEQVSKQLKEELSNYNTLLTERNVLKGDLKQAQSRLIELQKTLDQNKVSRLTVQKLQIEISQLRREREFFIDRNDSLQQETVRLAALQQETQKALDLATKYQDSIQQSNRELAERLMKGARLTISNLAARGVIQRNNGKFSITSRAKRTEMIQVCFTINENALAQSGDQTFYVQVLDNTSKMIGILRSETWENGNTISYNTKTTIPYKKKAYTICELVLPVQQMEIGDYTINVYNNEELILSTGLNLK